MRSIVLVAMAAAVSNQWSDRAHAQTLFEVEHARGNYRAGLVSEYDADLLRTWGVPTGNYPKTGLLKTRPPQTYGQKKQRLRAAKRRASQRRPG